MTMNKFDINSSIFLMMTQQSASQTDNEATSFLQQIEHMICFICLKLLCTLPAVFLATEMMS